MQNIWPTRKISMKQKTILMKLKKKKFSNFGANFFAKRFLSILYGNLSFNHMRKSFSEARQMKGKIGNNFLSLLEKRIDTVIYRMNICTTFAQVQQFISHKKVFVNGNPISIPSYQIKSGDIINIGCVGSMAIESSGILRNPKGQSRNFQSTKKNDQFLSIIKKASEALTNKALCNTKTLHLEVSYSTLSAIFLYPPQQLSYPSKFEIPQI